MTKEENSKGSSEGKNIEKADSAKAKSSAAYKEGNVEKMVLDNDMNRYDLILLARRWAYELKAQSEEPLSIQELINRSLDDIFSGRVTSKTIQALPPVPTVKKQKSSQLAILENIGKTDTQPSETSSEKTKSSDTHKKGK